MISKENEITIIDMGPLIENEDIQNQKETLSKIYDALFNQGFFYIINHGISSEELKFYLNECKRFFKDLPIEEKKRIGRTKRDKLIIKGYVEIGVENVDDSQPGILDIKEAIDICVSDPHPLYENQWPDEKYLPNWRKNVELFVSKLSNIGYKLLCALSVVMGENVNYFEPYYRDCQSSVVRFLRYPPRLEDTPMGCGVHSDYGILTLLLQDDIGGLQILLKDKWIDAVPIKDSLVINIGDCVEYLTNGKFKATKHRVINKSTTEERFVSLLFYEPNINMKLDCFPAFNQYPDPFPVRPTSFGTHLSGRINATYI